MATQKPNRNPQEPASYTLPCLLSNVLNLYVIYEHTARSIGSLSPVEFREFVEDAVKGRKVTIYEILEGITPLMNREERWYVMLELIRLKYVKYYGSQEQAEKALKKAA